MILKVTVIGSQFDEQRRTLGLPGPMYGYLIRDLLSTIFMSNNNQVATIREPGGGCTMVKRGYTDSLESS